MKHNSIQPTQLSKFLNDKGQTAVEYSLLLLVVVTLVLGVSRKLKGMMFGDGECPNDSLFCKVLSQFQAPGYLEGQYRYFTLKR